MSHTNSIVKAIVWFFIVASAGAQTMVPANDAENLLSAKEGEPLECHVAPLQPVLDFSLRFQAGYTIRVPLDQYRSGKHRWVIVTRVSAEGGDAPVYFVERLQFATEAKIEGAGEAGGGFALGAGRYHEFTLLDDQGRVCRAG